MKVEKLTLEHLAPYLPYGLNMQFEGNGGRIITLTGITNQGKHGTTITDGHGAMWLNSNGFKPLLRPLSQLTETITHNGEKLVPLVELLRLKENNSFSKDPVLRNMGREWKPEVISCKSQYFKSSDVNIHEVEYLVRTGNMGTLVYTFSYDDRFDRFSLRDATRDKNLGVGHQLQLFQKLHEWMFDLYGLIDSGLALPITNPQ